MRRNSWLLVLVLVLGGSACGGDSIPEPGPDAGHTSTGRDGGTTGARLDAARSDAGVPDAPRTIDAAPLFPDAAL